MLTFSDRKSFLLPWNIITDSVRIKLNSSYTLSDTKYELIAQ